MKKIKIKLHAAEYDVLIGKNIFGQCKNIFYDLRITKNFFVVVNKSVWDLYGEMLKNTLSSCADKVEFFILASSETGKNLRTVEKIFSAMLKNNFSRDTTVIAIGGGNIGDVAGFAAATFMRGVKLIHMPTTLLAAVDSAIGGKTGVNFMNSKNTIGAFYHPDAVIIDTNFFASLPKKEIVSGLGEVIKYSYLSEKKFYDELESELPKAVLQTNYDFTKVVEKSILVKASVVMQDEKESSLRKILNFGHTFGHAYESALKFKITHGDAIRLGMVSSLLLSHSLKLIDEKLLNKTLKNLLLFDFPSGVKNLYFENVYSFMMKDKKNSNGEIRFVLFKDFGKMILDFDTDKKIIEKIFSQTLAIVNNKLK